MRSRRIPSMAVPVRCLKCWDATFSVANPNDVDGAFTELISAGWMHRATKGAGRERWRWECPECRPKGPPTAVGLTTTGFFAKKPVD